MAKLGKSTQVVGFERSGTTVSVRSDGRVLKKHKYSFGSDGWKRDAVAERILQGRGQEHLTSIMLTLGYNVL